MPTHRVGRVLSVSPVVGIGEPNFTVQGAKFFNFFPHLHSYKPDFRIHIIRIRILPSKSKNTKINLDFYSFVTSYSLKKLGKKPNFLLAFWKPLKKEPGSRTENTTRILTFLTHLFFIFVNYINSCTPAIIAMKKIQAKTIFVYPATEVFTACGLFHKFVYIPTNPISLFPQGLYNYIVQE